MGTTMRKKMEIPNFRKIVDRIPWQTSNQSVLCMEPWKDVSQLSRFFLLVATKLVTSTNSNGMQKVHAGSWFKDPSNILEDVFEFMMYAILCISLYRAFPFQNLWDGAEGGEFDCHMYAAGAELSEDTRGHPRCPAPQTA